MGSYRVLGLGCGVIVFGTRVRVQDLEEHVLCEPPRTLSVGRRVCRESMHRGWNSIIEQAAGKSRGLDVHSIGEPHVYLLYRWV